MPTRPLRRARKQLLVAFMATALVLSTSMSAKADFIPDSTAYIQGTAGTSGPGYFTGSIAVDVTSTTSAVIQVSLTNTSPISNGGYITGFAFNDPNSSTRGNIGTVTSFTQSYSPAGAPPANNMVLIGDPTFNNTISGSPYGSFDIGAAVGGDLLGGGAPQPGVEVGQTGVFTFTVNGTNLNKLTAQNILDSLSTSGAAMMVRFRGFNNGMSDKVIAGEICYPPPPPPSPPPSSVPAPGGLLLGLIGAGCFLGRIRKRTGDKA
jgi:hypothetical protein